MEYETLIKIAKVTERMVGQMCRDIAFAKVWLIGLTISVSIIAWQVWDISIWMKSHIEATSRFLGY